MNENQNKEIKSHTNQFSFKNSCYRSNSLYRLHQLPFTVIPNNIRFKKEENQQSKVKKSSSLKPQKKYKEGNNNSRKQFQAIMQAIKIGEDRIKGKNIENFIPENTVLNNYSQSELKSLFVAGLMEYDKISVYLSLEV